MSFLTFWCFLEGACTCRAPAVTKRLSCSANCSASDRHSRPRALLRMSDFKSYLQRPIWSYSDALAFAALRRLALVVLLPPVFFSNGNNSVATKSIALQSGKYFANFRTDTSSPAVVSDCSFNSVKVRANTYVKSLRGNSIGPPLRP